MAYSRSFMFLGVILFVILSTQVLDANHVPGPYITNPMARVDNRLMFSESDLITMHKNLMKYDANTILKIRNIVNDLFDEENEVTISGEKNKVSLSDEEHQISKNDVEDHASLCHKEHQVSKKPMASVNSRLMFSESDLMNMHKNLMKYDANTILKIRDIVNDLFDEENEVSISNREEKVTKSNHEDEVFKIDEEHKISINDEEYKVSKSDNEDSASMNDEKHKVSKSGEENKVSFNITN
ncbi:uncharacterized protein LOC123916883 isoform X1 [Trifolium pratense]|uniref:Uncharacterized protein n=1 Tax=Trifolium pratense TaxID=57577 RepID=A0ACB0J710_TRIPR|nr:uncharacterized protein LOC123916883 isoform X1 [Trifolium pratense]CAJ2639901.1 unnamed protein product [Trifolium pratense]